MNKKILLKTLGLVTVSSLFMYSPVNAADATTPATNDNSNISYTIGYQMGQNISQDPNLKSINLNNDKLAQGFKDATQGSKAALTDAQMEQSMTAFRTQMMKKMQAEQEQKTKNQATNFLKVEDSIYNSNLTPRSDVKDPAVVIYEFFDYQCMYCSKISPEIDKAMAQHKDVQVVFVEFPIFSQRAPASKYAAEVGTAVYKAYGPAAYVKYHDGIFAIGQDEGKLTNATIEKVATDAGADMTKIATTIKDDKIADHVQATLKMGFDKLGIQGTPFVVVAPAKNATTANTTVIGGYTSSAVIDKAITKAKA